jgi:predicted ATPase
MESRLRTPLSHWATAGYCGRRSSLMQLLICSETGRFERPINQTRFSFTTVVCTAALVVHLGHPFSPLLISELGRIKIETIYQTQVFFIRNLGFVTPTEARRISFEDTVRFEKTHEDTYRDFGFELVSVESGSVVERVSLIKAAISQKCVSG